MASTPDLKASIATTRSCDFRIQLKTWGFARGWIRRRLQRPTTFNEFLRQKKIEQRLNSSILKRKVM